MNSNRAIKGETIVESLVSMLIIVLIFVFLTNAVMTSARVNAGVSSADSSLDASNAKQSGDIHLIVDGEKIKAKLYEVDDDNGDARFYYYEHEETS